MVFISKDIQNHFALKIITQKGPSYIVLEYGHAEIKEPVQRNLAANVATALQQNTLFINQSLLLPP